jgi:two-component system, NtrC family, nitrogen regulation sensor histidine kinase NtrY
MASGRYNRSLLFPVVLLAITSLSIFWVYFAFHAWITVFNLCLVWLLLVGLLLFRVQRVNRDITRFFQALHDRDSSLAYTKDNADPVFRDLYEQMNLVLKNLGTIKSEKDKEFNFFSAIFNHADVGLMVYDDAGEIVMANNTARLLIGIRGNATGNGLNQSGPSVSEQIKAVQPGEKALIRIDKGSEVVQLSIRSRKIILPDRKLNLVSLQNIRQELELIEIESWQKLIRVLVHEITNSVSPITLTASGILQILELQDKPSREQMEGIISGLQAIRKRSKGMAAFVESYRQLTRIPTPNFNRVAVQQMFDNLGRLMKDELDRRGIEFRVIIAPREITVWCDEQLVEQVLINLLRNASESLAGIEQGVIMLTCVQEHDAVLMSVTDNGQGISPDLLESIFIPFFSTKPEGSGIGLSISRQLMNLHKGRISVQSKPGKTSFNLHFPVQTLKQ